MMVILLTAGNAERLKPIIANGEKALLEVEGKPMVIELIQKYMKKEVNRFVIVTNSSNKSQIEEVVNDFFKYADLKIDIVVQSEVTGPGVALSLCAEFIDQPVAIHLADTICELEGEYKGNWIGVQEIFSEYSKWCIVETNDRGVVKHLIDKPTQNFSKGYAAIGMYFFEDYYVLRKILSNNKDIRELSDCFIEFMKIKEISIWKFNEWKDIGNLKDYIKYINRSMGCRHFNSLEIDEWGSCIKKSENKEKLKQEVEWYQNVQEFPSIKRLIPSIYSVEKDSYSMECLDYPMLSYLFLYKRIPKENWMVLIEKFLELMQSRFWKQTKEVSNARDLCKKMYIDKLEIRMKEWDVKDLLDREYIYINKSRYYGFPALQKFLYEDIEKLLNSIGNNFGVIHGDLVFSNILITPRRLQFKLLDARGNFGENGVYGDVRYDIAKLRQCYHGMYDFIMADAYYFKENSEGNYQFALYSQNPIDYLKWDAEIDKMGYSIDEIEIIEILLFISLIPLHAENKMRQKVFFLRAIQILNQHYFETMKKSL